MSQAANMTVQRAPGRQRVLARVLLGAMALLLVAYLGISTAAAWILTTPRRLAATTTPARAGLEYQDVRFPARGGDAQLAGGYVPSTGSRRAVVLVHGKDSSRAAELGGHFVDLAAGLHRRGIAVLLIDLRGHGDSGEGRFGFGLIERRDVIGAVDWLEAQGFAPGSIGVLGVSLGAASAIGAAHDDADIGALVADCSYADIYPVMQMHWREASGLPEVFLPSTLLAGRVLLGRDLAQSRPVDEIGALANRPVLIIHGTADRFTPLEHGRELAAADQAAEFWQVPGAGHAESYAANPAAYVERVAAFFQRGLPEGP
jgi:pimeloyl-ACP methyl ester carboxylesterase